jgi:hypothetical protein
MGQNKASRVGSSGEDLLQALRRVYAAHFERVRKEQRSSRARARRRWKGEGQTA